MKTGDLKRSIMLTGGRTNLSAKNPRVFNSLEDEIKLRPDAPRGLGSVSTQTAESMHSSFEKYFERFNPHWNCPKLLVEELYRATTSWASKCLWPVDVDGDKE